MQAAEETNLTIAQCVLPVLSTLYRNNEEMTWQQLTASINGPARETLQGMSFSDATPLIRSLTLNGYIEAEENRIVLTEYGSERIREYLEHTGQSLQDVEENVEPAGQAEETALPTDEPNESLEDQSGDSEDEEDLSDPSVTGENDAREEAEAAVQQAAEAPESEPEPQDAGQPPEQAPTSQLSGLPWKDIVGHIILYNGGTATLQFIYDQIQTNGLNTTSAWKATIRKTVQNTRCFTRVDSDGERNSAAYALAEGFRPR